MKNRILLIFTASLFLILAALPAKRQSHLSLPEADDSLNPLWRLRRMWQQSLDPQSLLRLMREEYEASKLAPGASSGWMSIGPRVAGKINKIVFHPHDSKILYVGADGGGVWKADDGGKTWTPLTDSLPSLEVGALAIAPSNPDTLYLGTGIRSNGAGIIKSTDAGQSWTLPDTAISPRVFHISVHPTNADEVLAGAETGAFRSTDGGRTWINTRFGSVYDICRHPTNLQTIYATTNFVDFQNRSTVIKSTDGGRTWEEKGQGLTTSQSLNAWRMSLAMSESNPSVLYAATSISRPGSFPSSHIYKTTDGGENWVDLSDRHGNYLQSQVERNNALTVSPSNPDIVIAGGVDYVRTTDGGASWDRPPFGEGGIHVDAVDMEFRGSTLWIANDGGLWSSQNNGDTTVAHNDGLVTRQFYTMALDQTNTDRMLAGSQDNGTSMRREPSTTWSDVFGGDGFDCAINPLRPSTIYVTFQFGFVFRARNGDDPNPEWMTITPPFSIESAPFGTLLKMDMSDPKILYSASYRVFKTTDEGSSWVTLPVTTTDGSEWRTDVSLTDIALTKSNPAVLMATNTLAVFRSVDGGSTWVDASNGHLTYDLEIDPKDALRAYACVLASEEGTLRPRVYQTTNGGETWGERDSGLPQFFKFRVRVDPVDSNVLYCGTDVGLFWSTDQGASWARLGGGLPFVSVTDIQLLDDGSLVRAATYGRGVWELRSPLATPAIRSATKSGKKLFVEGEKFDARAVVLLNGREQKTANDPANPATRLICKKAGKKIKPGDRLQVKNPNGALSAEFIFAR
ncbi:MAG: hypothetical protein AB1631_00590 [Acidobacteriota bacterium]